MPESSLHDTIIDRHIRIGQYMQYRITVEKRIGERLRKGSTSSTVEVEEKGA